MDLHAGLPYWIVKNPLWNYYNPLQENTRVRVAVIGSGITGALVAHELCRNGIDCCVIDKRTVSTGSSCASTALLQYEIDIPLYQMAEMMPEADAVAAYRACLDSIGDLQRILETSGVDAGFRKVPSVYYASNSKGLRSIREEYKMRRKHDFPADYLSRKDLYERMGIRAPGALMNRVSAQVDAYAASTGLLAHDLEKNNLRIFTHTEIGEWTAESDGYLLKSSEGYTVKCDHVIIAAGFEALPFLPEKLMQLTSTFAVISQPVDESCLWPERSLIWETREPYLYIRTDDSNRIIVGGEDIPYNSAAARKFLLDKKAGILEKKFRRLYPDIPFATEMAWAGTFSSTKDGLPLIGAAGGDPRMLFALGYGGNGITFSVIAARVLSRLIRGETDPLARIFNPERDSLR